MEIANKRQAIENVLISENKKTHIDRLKLVSYTHLRAHETVLALVCRILLEKKKYKDIVLSKGDAEIKTMLPSP